MYYTYSDGWNNIAFSIDNVDLVSDSTGQYRHTIPDIDILHKNGQEPIPFTQKLVTKSDMVV